MTDIPSIDIEKYVEIFNGWATSKGTDLVSFRNQTYTSAVTGTEASRLDRPWTEIMGEEF